MAAEAGDRRDRPPAWFTGMSRRTTQALRFVNDEQIDARANRLVGQLRAVDEHLEGNHGAAVHVERIEVRAEIPRHVGKPRRVEQREHLVVLPPQLSQPLHGQRVGRDDETALDLPGMHQPVEDERCFDGLAEPDFVGKEPAHRIAGSRAFRDMELVWKETDAPPEERSKTVGFAYFKEAQEVQPDHEILDVVEIAEREAFDERPFEIQRP